MKVIKEVRQYFLAPRIIFYRRYKMKLKTFIDTTREKWKAPTIYADCLSFLLRHIIPEHLYTKIVLVEYTINERGGHMWKVKGVDLPNIPCWYLIQDTDDNFQCIYARLKCLYLETPEGFEVYINPLGSVPKEIKPHLRNDRIRKNKDERR